MRLLPSDPTAAPPMADFLAEHTHAFARAELLAAWSRHHLDAAIRTGSVTRLLPGVYCGRAHTRHPVVMGEAATLWAPRALVTGALALHLYNSRLPAPALADVVTTNGDTLHPPEWIRVHQAGKPRRAGLPQGVPCVPAPRALLDAWRYAAGHERRPVLWEALWARVCTWRQLQAELGRTARVAGRRDLERVLSWFEGGATTPLEVRAQYETFGHARFSNFQWQVDLLAGSHKYTVDMFHRAAMLVVELDGDKYHSTRQARDGDRERQTNLTAAGYVVVRFGWNDVVSRPNWCRERLLRVLAGRLSRPNSH